MWADVLNAHIEGARAPVESRSWAARKRGGGRCGNEFIPHRMVGRSAAGMGDMRCTGSEKGRSHAEVRVRMPEKGTFSQGESTLRGDTQCVG